MIWLRGYSQVIKEESFMIGALLGDMIGSVYEFDRGGKTKDFPLFQPDSQFTDDSVMTIAVAHAMLDAFDGPRLGAVAAGHSELDGLPLAA